MKHRIYIALVAVLALIVLAVSLVSQKSVVAAPTDIEVGTSQGLIASEFVGRVDQNGTNFTAYGYLTHISGLTDTLLFSTTNPSLANETNARITYYATATLTARSVISSVFVIDSVGVTTYHFNGVPNASFGNPSSFNSGVPIVTATIRYQDILNVQAPNLGIATGTGEFTQNGLASFSLNGQTYRVGRVGMVQRIVTTGEGTRTDPVTPKSFVVQAGNTVITVLPGAQTFLPVISR
jgi:hypothetical protein